MSRLKNEFSWSFSRASTFRECQKKYWYNYYGSWEGWPKTPYDTREAISPLAAYLYRMKQMQSVPMFVGSCVHKAIENFLKKPSSLEELIQDAKKLFEQGLIDSETKKWQEAPKKHANLFEHYYGGSVAGAASLQKITQSLASWFSSPIVQNLALSPKAQRLSVEELASFPLVDEEMKATYPIIVVIDFAVKWPVDKEHVAILFDWKTGMQTDKTQDQLYLYALFAQTVWKFPLDRIILSPFYVALNSYTKIGFQQKEPIVQGRLNVIEQEVRTSCREMVAKLGKEEIPDPTLFSYTEERKKCARCPFKELCQKAEYKEHSLSELEALVTPACLTPR